MAFSCKIVLAHRAKEDGSRAVYLQAIIDRARATVPLGFYLHPATFDARRQIVKPTARNAESFTTEFQLAISRAAGIASKYRIDGKLLTPEAFRKEFANPSEKMDFIAFMAAELSVR